MSLRDTTHALLLQRAEKQSLKEIAAEAEVSYEWLRHFWHRKSPNPGVMHVQRLYEFLSGKPLRLDDAG